MIEIELVPELGHCIETTARLEKLLPADW